MPDYSTWFSKQQAADALGIPAAAVEKLTSEQQIRLAYWRRPETGEKLCVYDPDDVERIRKERNLGEDERSGADRGDARFDPTGELGQGFAQALAAALQRSASGVRITERLYLSLSEAVELSGLPEEYLRERMRDGSLPSIETEDGLRIKRADLEKKL
jgi:hypothetical protein